MDVFSVFPPSPKSQAPISPEADEIFFSFFSHEMTHSNTHIHAQTHTHTHREKLIDTHKDGVLGGTDDAFAVGRPCAARHHDARLLVRLRELVAHGDALPLVC